MQLGTLILSAGPDSPTCLWRHFLALVHLTSRLARRYGRIRCGGDGEPMDSQSDGIFAIQQRDERSGLKEFVAKTSFPDCQVFGPAVERSASKRMTTFSRRLRAAIIVLIVLRP